MRTQRQLDARAQRERSPLGDWLEGRATHVKAVAPARLDAGRDRPEGLCERGERERPDAGLAPPPPAGALSQRRPAEDLAEVVDRAVGRPEGVVVGRRADVAPRAADERARAELGVQRAGVERLELLEQDEGRLWELDQGRQATWEAGGGRAGDARKEGSVEARDGRGEEGQAGLAEDVGRGLGEPQELERRVERDESQGGGRPGRSGVRAADRPG